MVFASPVFPLDSEPPLPIKLKVKIKILQKNTRSVLWFLHGSYGRNGVWTVTTSSCAADGIACQLHKPRSPALECYFNHCGQRYVDLVTLTTWRKCFIYLAPTCTRTSLMNNGTQHKMTGKEHCDSSEILITCIRPHHWCTSQFLNTGYMCRSA